MSTIQLLADAVRVGDLIRQYLAGVTPQMVYRYVHIGIPADGEWVRLRAWKLGRQWYSTPSEVEAFFAKAVRESAHA